MSKTRISATTQTRTMCNAETQTDETDFYLMYQVSSVIPQRKPNTALTLTPDYDTTLP